MNNMVKVGYVHSEMVDERVLIDAAERLGVAEVFTYPIYLTGDPVGEPYFQLLTTAQLNKNKQNELFYAVKACQVMADGFDREQDSHDPTEICEFDSDQIDNISSSYETTIQCWADNLNTVRNCWVLRADSTEACRVYVRNVTFTINDDPNIYAITYF